MVSGVSLCPSSSLGDVFIPNWEKGQPSGMDITVILAIYDLTVTGASTTPGHVLKVAEDITENITLYSDGKNSGVSFINTAVDTIGGWSHKAIQHILGLAVASGSVLALVLQTLLATSSSVQRSLATSISGVL